MENRLDQDLKLLVLMWFVMVQYLHRLQDSLAGLWKHEPGLNHRAQLRLRRYVVPLQPLHIVSELPASASIYKTMLVDKKL